MTKKTTYSTRTATARLRALGRRLRDWRKPGRPLQLPPHPEDAVVVLTPAVCLPPPELIQRGDKVWVPLRAPDDPGEWATVEDLAKQAIAEARERLARVRGRHRAPSRRWGLFARSQTDPRHGVAEWLEKAAR